MLYLLISAAFGGTCDAYGGLQEISTFDVMPELTESSGLAVSRTRGVYYTHQDSGSNARIYAFAADGSSRGTSTVEGGAMIDWEDLSLGACHDDPAQDCLFIGDVGDNGRLRESVQVYEVREPTTDGAALPVIATWNVAYPDHPRDSEAIMVHPLSGAIYLATKDWEGHEEIFRFPEAPTAEGETGLLTLVAAFDLVTDKDKLVTGADYDPEGERVVLRTYASVIEWRADPCDPEAAWAGEYRVWPVSGELQGEAVAYDRSSGDLLTTSEGTPMPLNRVPCLTFEEGDTACGLDTGDAAETSEVEPLSQDEGCGGCGGQRAWVLLLPLGLGARRRRERGG